MKNIAIIIKNVPHGNAKGREALDIALASSDINHITVFFIDEGVFHLLPNQNSETVLMRDYIATLNMLTLYDIDDLYVCKSSILTRNLLNIEFNLVAKMVDTTTLNNLLHKQDAIITF